MDSSSGYASINMSTSLGSPKKTTKSKKLSFWTPKTPEGGLKAFKCQSRALWFLIIASAIVIEYDRLFTQERFWVNLIFFDSRSRYKSAIQNYQKSFTFWHLFLDTVIIYEIFVNWRLVKLKNPIFNDGVWFDVPPRGWDFWFGLKVFFCISADWVKMIFAHEKK